MKLRILHILHTLRVGGLENGVVNLINRLDPESFEHYVCCVDASGPMSERFVRPVRIVEMGKGSGRDYLLPLKLARVIRGLQPDLVHTRNWGTVDGIVGARLAGVGRVIHGEHGREAADPTGANIRRNRARKLLAPLVTRFVAVSGDLAGWLVGTVGIPEGKVRCIINGVDTDRFRPVANREAVRRLLRLPAGKFLVGTVGRLDPVKDQATLLRSFVAAPGMGDALLVVVGVGPEEATLRQLAGSLGITDRVRFLGERSDVREVLQALDLFVLPSIAEGISNTILEAMACGLPVVASRVGGNGELLEEGASGAFFRVKDRDGLAALLARYQAAPALCAAHGARGRERAERLFSLDRMTHEYADLYESAFKGVS